MKKIAMIILVLFCSATVFGQHKTQTQPVRMKVATLMPGLGAHHHPVSTKNAQAQKFFDQGLTLIYAFNHGAAIQSFQRALELDPELAMAHWGIALATGPNYNEPEVSADREKTAHEETQKAASLAANATQIERDYIDALSKRYSDDPKADFKKLGSDYRAAMKQLMEKYPDDLDAATLYAESIMTPNAWKLYGNDYKPAEGTEEIVSALESVMRRDPDHIGANHLYIHATEGSANPERAIPSAERLGNLTPNAGHLVHMPAHTYIRAGEYEKAANSNRNAIRVDEAYFKSTGDRGIYRLMYYHHNVHFLSAAAGIEGNYTEARKNADKVCKDAAPHLKDLPMVEMFLPSQIYVLVHFKKWDDIMKLPEPDKAAKYTDALWHWARGMAHAANGKFDDAQTERNAMSEIAKAMTATYDVGFNRATVLTELAENVLDAQMALGNKDKDATIESLKKAVTIEDTLAYNEPPDWFFSVRPTLGAIVLQKGDSKEAEKIFREDLEKHPRSGRALFGLMESLKAQGRNDEAKWVEREFAAAWKNADTKLSLEDL